MFSILHLVSLCVILITRQKEKKNHAASKSAGKKYPHSGDPGVLVD